MEECNERSAVNGMQSLVTRHSSLNNKQYENRTNRLRVFGQNSR
jgi:hypothetical protein